MEKINPKISQNLLKEIKNQKTRVIKIGKIKIKVCKNVFPPKSVYSHTSEKLYKIFGDIRGMSVLDVGTGTGIQAIQAALHGAKNITALDINPKAVSCAKENVKINNLESKITIIKSNLFKSIKNKSKFDVVIANLPIVNFPIKGIVESALYDPNYKIHNRFFKGAKKYLNKQGFIVITHINFRGEKDFTEFENSILHYGYIIEKFIEFTDQKYPYRWRMYRIRLKNVV